MYNLKNNKTKISDMPRIAIIGAGFSGIILGRELQKNFEVEIFEKARGCGGRMSTRYAENFIFDHGIQFFTAKTTDFKNFLQPFIASGEVVIWAGKEANFIKNKINLSTNHSEDRLVSSPGMNSLCKNLGQNLNIKLNTELLPISEKNNYWQLIDKNSNDLGVFDFVISTAPPIQTINLFGDNIPRDHLLRTSLMEPCFSLMVGFNFKWDKDWVFAKVYNNPIKIISVNSSKPGRNSNVTSLVIHSEENWSKKHIEDDLKTVEKSLIENFEKITKIDCSKADYINTHRWRYALVKEAKDCEVFLDEKLRIAATGDWASNSRIEDIWYAAKKLSEKIKNYFDENLKF